MAESFAGGPLTSFVMAGAAAANIGPGGAAEAPGTSDSPRGASMPAAGIIESMARWGLPRSPRSGRQSSATRRAHRGARLAALFSLLLLPALAAAATYTFTVTAINGPLDEQQASGSFSYTPGPAGLNAGLEFDDFELTWDGVTYDEGDALAGFVRLRDDGSLRLGWGPSAIGSRCRVGGCRYGGSGGADFVMHIGLGTAMSGHGLLDGAKSLFRYTRADGSSGLGTVTLERQP